MFTVARSLPPIANRSKIHVYLIVDGWDDWGKYRTMFSVYVVDAAGETHALGSVKIGEVGLKPRSAQQELEPGFRVPTLNPEFESLEQQHFSLGQSENYYETLNALDPDLKHLVLSGLRDCAYDLAIFDSNRSEDVMSESLLRDVQALNVHNRYHRLARGDAVLTRFQFDFTFPPQESQIKVPTLQFDVVPYSEPPTNIHVLIGRNGVGKTRCVQNLCKTVLNRQNTDPVSGQLVRRGSNADEWSFAGLVYVSFSVFDDFDLPVSGDAGVHTAQVGLRFKHVSDDGEIVQVKTPNMLANDFAESLAECRSGPRASRWRAAIKTLEADPLFEEANITELLSANEEVWRDASMKLFGRLSSGHAIVLLTMTRLVELVDERTLVILDEPEGHLHPPLLSAFVRSVADLLGKRNGVALIATHSPVVLQEVPQSCAWKLRRSGTVSVAERPTVETFGENVGTLTSEVFGLEVTRSGFHNLLAKAVAKPLSYEDLLEHFSEQLGSEARAIARGLIAARDNTPD